MIFDEKMVCNEKDIVQWETRCCVMKKRMLRYDKQDADYSCRNSNSGEKTLVEIMWKQPSSAARPGRVGVR